MKSTFAFTSPYNGAQAECTANTSAKKLSAIEFLFFVVMIFYYFLPSFSAAVPLTLLVALCTMYTMLQCVLHTKETEYFLWLLMAAGIISFMYYILTDTSTIAVGVSHYIIKRFLSKFEQVFMSFFPLLIFYRIATTASRKQKILLLLLMAGLFLYVVVNTMIELAVNENATRSWGEFDEQTEKNVGTYAYVYVVPVVVSCLPYLYASVREKNALYKVLIWGVGIFLFVFLLFAQYTLALLISVFVLILQISRNIKNSLNKVFLCGALFLLLIASPTILNFFAEKVPSKQMATRLRQIANFFRTGDTDSQDLGGRLHLYWETMKAFFRSPLLGNRKLDFDGHATLLTIFADIGIFGGACYISLFVLAKKSLGRLLSKRQISIFKPTFIGLILMGLTNPIHAATPLGASVWLLIPLMILVIGGNKKNERALED